MPTSKKIRRAAAFLLVFAALNALLTFLLTPYSSPSTEMWDGYYKRSDDSLDVIYIGTSQCYESINPEITDPITGYASYNMGTNAQSLMDTERALEQAFADHDLQEVVLVLDYDCLMRGKDRYARPEASFIYAMNRHLPFAKRIQNDLRFVLDPDYFTQAQSLNFWFPWLSNRSNMHFEYLLQNAWAKLTGTTPEPNDLNNVRNAFGYKAFRKVINYNTAEAQKTVTWKESKLSSEALDTASSICALCQEHGASLTVLVTPVPVSAVLCYGEDYFKRLSWVKAFFAEHGASFYDFNLADETLFQRDETYFKDWIHLNDDGASAFSRAVGQLLVAQRQEEDVDAWFLSQDDFLHAITGIDSTYLKLSSNPGEGIQGTAYAYTGADCEVEFEILVREEGEAEFRILKEYDTAADFHYVPSRAGTCYFQVNARRCGSDAAFDRYHVDSVEYWKS